MFIDPHVHVFSPDATLSLKQLLREAELKEIDVVIVTDHDMFSRVGNPNRNSVRIFAGMEISSNEGHVLAYGITEAIPPLTIEEVLDRVHGQGGIAVAAHPYRHFEKEGLEPSPYSMKDKLFELDFDGIESINGFNNTKENRRSKKAAELLQVAKMGGSDAHSSGEVGKAYTVTRSDINSIEDFITAVRKREVQARMGRWK